MGANEQMFSFLNIGFHMVLFKPNISRIKTTLKIIGRATVSLDAFENGLSALAVLDAIRSNPKAFQSSFVYSPSNLTSDTLDDLFKVRDSPVGSNKAVIESLQIFPLARLSARY